MYTCGYLRIFFRPKQASIWPYSHWLRTGNHGNQHKNYARSFIHIRQIVWQDFVFTGILYCNAWCITSPPPPFLAANVVSDYRKGKRSHRPHYKNASCITPSPAKTFCLGLYTRHYSSSYEKFLHGRHSRYISNKGYRIS